MRSTDYVTDKLLAPERSKFTLAEIPDMSGVDAVQGQRGWMSVTVTEPPVRMR